MKHKIIAVDFDGTLCEDKFPDIGPPRLDVIEKLLEEQRAGARVILWTCRRGVDLLAAIYWSLDHCIAYDAVNENLPETIAEFGGDTRKIYADEYWDDKATSFFTETPPAPPPHTIGARLIANEFTGIVKNRLAENAKAAEKLGPFVYEGVEAKIREDEAARIMSRFQIILKHYGFSASERSKK